MAGAARRRRLVPRPPGARRTAARRRATTSRPTYNLWLVGHQLGRGEAPWLDPYSFQPETDRAAEPAGLAARAALLAARGGVRAGRRVERDRPARVRARRRRGRGRGCARSTCRRGAALAGGLVFALAPYRVAQSAGHLLGLIAFLLPLALLGFERARRPRPHARLVARGAAPRSRRSRSPARRTSRSARSRSCSPTRSCGRASASLLLGAGAGAAAATSRRPRRARADDRRLDRGRRPLARSPSAATRRSSATSSRATLERELEQFVLLGWATPLLALVGLVAARARGPPRRSPRCSRSASLVPVVLALGTRTCRSTSCSGTRCRRSASRACPSGCCRSRASRSRRSSRSRSPGIRRPRRARGARCSCSRSTCASTCSSRSRPTSDDAAYAALAAAPPARLLELPVFSPDRHYGSAYLYYVLQAPRERPGGYSTTAPLAADRRRAPAAAARLRRRGRRSASACSTDLGVRYVAVHRRLYAPTVYVGAVCVPRAERALEEHGFRRVGGDDSRVLYARSPGSTPSEGDAGG